MPITTNTSRHAALRQLLTARRREMHDTVGRRILDGRIDMPTEGRDDLEHSEDDNQLDLECALLQMRAETIARINAAVARIDGGTYGWCPDCSGRIADKRLRALPFALRCQPCEETREGGRAPSRRRDQLSVHADVTASL